MEQLGRALVRELEAEFRPIGSSMGISSYMAALRTRGQDVQLFVSEHGIQVWTLSGENVLERRLGGFEYEDPELLPRLKALLRAQE